LAGSDSREHTRHSAPGARGGRCRGLAHRFSCALYSRIGYLEYDRRSQGDFSLVFMGKHLGWTKLDDTEVGEMQGQMEEVSMRKVIASELVSLDGVMESPEQWHFPYFNDEMGA
jgi:hypothetical protein